MSDTWLYNAWFVSVGANVTIAGGMLLLFLALRRRENMFVGAVLLAIASEKILALLSDPEMSETLGRSFFMYRTVGNGILMAGLMIYGLHRFGLLNGVAKPK